jgi:phytoene dehydrogenase-like protein
MAGKPMEETVDILIVGAGHNGLVAAALLAKEKHSVLVVEDKDVIGGCVRTEHPFSKVPGMGASTGAYLLGLMPPELMQKLGIEIPYVPRDPYSFVPNTKTGYLLFGSNGAETKRQFLEYFSEEDWVAAGKLDAELAALRDDVGPTWLMEPLTIEETAAKYVRPELRKVFIDLCRKPIRDYLERFGFKSNKLKAMYAVTDGFSGLNAGWDNPGTGMNFLIHNMCRLPNSGGQWNICRGGMGEVPKRIAEVARKNGARIETSRGVFKLILERQGGDIHIKGAIMKDGRKVYAKTVIVNADPYRMRDMIGRGNLPDWYNHRLDKCKRDGTTLKVNMCLKALPTFTCLPEDKGQFVTTTHILPEGDDVIDVLRKSYAEAKEGKLPAQPAIEMYIHSTVDPSIQDKAGHHNAALFVEWVPYEIAGSSWEKEEERYVKHLLSMVDKFAPGFSDLVIDTFVLTPPKLEQHFGITRGHIHHIDNSFGFSDRLPYNTPIKGLYSCSAGTHPGGSVIGCGGHNAAMRVLKDLSTAPSAPKL